MIDPITTYTGRNGNPGIVPPWLQGDKPPVVVLHAEIDAVARPFKSGALVESQFGGAGTYVALVDRAHALVNFGSGLERVPVASLVARIGEVR